jgi:hypothetical protein
MEDAANWCVRITSPAQYAEIVRLIAANGWPCTPVLTEEDGFERAFDRATAQVFWDEREGKLWKGRWDDCPEIPLEELPQRVGALLAGRS